MTRGPDVTRRPGRRATPPHPWSRAHRGPAVPEDAQPCDRHPGTTAEEARGWQAHTLGPFGLRVFGGGHFFLAGHRATVVELPAGQSHRARSGGATVRGG